MNPYGDVVMYAERFVDGAWVRHADFELLDRGASNFRRLQCVPGLEVLRKVDDVPSVALTVRELRAASWEDGDTHDGFIPFRRHSSWDNEPYVDWRKTSPRRSPDSFDVGCPAGVIVEEDAAEAVLARADEEEAEEILRAPEPDAGRVYVLVYWRATHRERAAGFCERLDADIAPLGEPDDVRVVFTNA